MCILQDTHDFNNIRWHPNEQNRLRPLSDRAPHRLQPRELHAGRLQQPQHPDRASDCELMEAFFSRNRAFGKLPVLWLASGHPPWQRNWPKVRQKAPPDSRTASSDGSYRTDLKDWFGGPDDSCKNYIRLTLRASALDLHSLKLGGSASWSEGTLLCDGAARICFRRIGAGWTCNVLPGFAWHRKLARAVPFECLSVRVYADLCDNIPKGVARLLCFLRYVWGVHPGRKCDGAAQSEGFWGAKRRGNYRTADLADWFKIGLERSKEYDGTDQKPGYSALVAVYGRDIDAERWNDLSSTLYVAELPVRSASLIRYVHGRGPGGGDRSVYTRQHQL